MASSSDNNNKDKRTTISLKTNTGGVASKSPSAGSKTVEIEIKRKKHGLTLDSDKESRSSGRLFSKNSKVGNLTDQEFKARVKALQDAMKDDKETAIHVKSETEKPAAKIAEVPTVMEEQTKEQTLKVYAQQNETSEIAAEPVSRSKFQSQKKKPVSAEGITHVVFKASDYSRDKKTELPKKPTVVLDTPDVLAKPTPSRVRAKDTEDVVEQAQAALKKRSKVAVKAKPFVKKGAGNSKISRTVIDRVMNNDLEERTRSMAALKRARMKLKSSGKDQDIAKVVRDVSIPDSITVGELANRMAVRSADVIKYLMTIGTLVTVNQSIDGDTAEVICTEFGHTPKRVSEADVENELNIDLDDPKDLAPRAPIVAIMGHVDHGKTTLLDTIRKTSVAQKEAGGITQHVAAYQIETKAGKKITFIDTPGHAAFSNIRSRGAVITDIIVLVVAADDGIKDQTIEAIRHAKAQNVPIVVAINKIDKPNINIDRVKTELMNHEIILEDFGGEVLSVEISALKNINLEGLLDTILLQADVLELSANKNRKAIGTVLESRVDKGKGIISSLIIQRGTLRTGDIFVAGASFGKVRTIYDDKGKRILAAGPSTPIELVGFNSAPEPGVVLSVVDSEQKAREIAEYRARFQKSSGKKETVKSIDQMMAGQKIETTDLNLMVKADVAGSLEAIVASIEMLHHPEINLNIVEKSVGIISESDIDFARNTGATIIGFNVSMTAAAKAASKLDGIKVLSHSVIYHITEEVKNMMSTLLSPIVEENHIGTAEVRKIFMISKYGMIAGCYVINGTMKRSDSKIKVKRDGKTVYEGKMRSMKHEKDEIKEARQSHECGILAEGFNDFKEGDLIECYEIVLKSRSVD